MTGFYRNGCCDTGEEDSGSHTVCAVMTEAFLKFSKERGNDLSTPRPEYGFPGLVPGDRTCSLRMHGSRVVKICLSQGIGFDLEPSNAYLMSLL
jgi:uncharacterized protein (DUF2237 family)